MQHSINIAIELCSRSLGQLQIAIGRKCDRHSWSVSRDHVHALANLDSQLSGVSGPRSYPQNLEHVKTDRY